MFFILDWVNIVLILILFLETPGLHLNDHINLWKKLQSSIINITQMPT